MSPVILEDPAEVLWKERGARRHQTNIRGIAWRSGRSIPVLVHDLSETGVRLQTDQRMVVNETLEIEIPYAGRITARVIWANATECGCMLDVPITRGRVGEILLGTGGARAGIPTEPEIIEALKPLPLYSKLVVAGCAALIIEAAIAVFLIS